MLPFDPPPPENIRKQTVKPLGTMGRENPQLSFTCSKSKIETLEKGVKYVYSSQ